MSIFYTRNVQGHRVKLELIEVSPDDVTLDPTNPRIGFSMKQLQVDERSDSEPGTADECGADEPIASPLNAPAMRADAAKSGIASARSQRLCSCSAGDIGVPP